MKAVIFDMDGVLIDSTKVVYEGRSRVLSRHGVNLSEVPDPHHEGHKGSSTRLLVEAVREHTGVKLDDAAFSDEVTAELPNAFRNTTVDPELVKLLDDLKRHDVSCAIATSGRMGGVQLKLKVLGIADFFAHIVTAEDVTNHKPDPEIYLAAASRLGVPPSECLVIEDSCAGIAAGRAAGCLVIGFTGFNSEKRPLAGAAVTVDSWSDLSFSRLISLR